jgi:copper resistance protein B
MKALAAVLAAAFASTPVHAQHHAHAAQPADTMQAHGGHAPATQALDEHAAHAGHPAPAAQAPSPYPAPTAAERAAAFPPELEGMDMRAHMDDDPLVAVLRGERLERVEGGTLAWDLRAGLGHTFDKLWLRSEGERRDGGLEHTVTELLWNHATGPWWDRTLGLRHDSNPGGRDRDWLAIGVQGLAPYKFELEATGYLGASGRVAARVEAEYEALLTNRLVLQPRLEANLYGRDDEENRISKGLANASLGLRLRYEFSPRFAPYLGYAWTRRFGDTADRYRAAGDPASEHGWVAGVRFWF